MLTKEQINSIRHVVTCDDLHLTECASEELRRLALLGLERDPRAERVGRAVLADCALTRFAIETAIDTIRNGDGFDDDDIPKLRAIADAMEESDD